jgi:hypothetical protein
MIEPEFLELILSDVLSLFSENFAFSAKREIFAFDAHFSVSPEYLVLGQDNCYQTEREFAYGRQSRYSL